MDWDDAFANRTHIPDADRLIAQWPVDAARFRRTACGTTDIAYGPEPRARYDLFLPERPPRGLFVFIHGGYWMAFGKSDWSHLAAGPLGRGWAVMLPGYGLCPDLRISEITRRIGAALAHAAVRVPGPIALCGHSAGGHLAMRTICEDTPLEAEAADRVVHTLGISGLYDLRPLRRTAMNATLKLTEAEAVRESPALLAPRPGARATVWVGAQERPEFRRQSALLTEAWARYGLDVGHVEAPGRHHFDVIAPLADPGSNLTRAALGRAIPDGGPNRG